MLAIAIGIGSSVWADKIKPHPYRVLGLGIAGAISFLSPLIKKGLELARPKNEHPWAHLQDVDASGNKFMGAVETNTGNMVAGDNIGGPYKCQG